MSSAFVSALLLALLLARGHGQDQADDKCQFYCKQCGERGLGLRRMYDRLLGCQGHNVVLNFLAQGPGRCRVPDFYLSRKEALKYFPLRVCRQELKCIASAGRQRHNSSLKRKMMAVLERRAKKYALLDELRFSKQRPYVRAVDALTNPGFVRDLKAHVKARGFETRTRFRNPVFQRNKNYLRENTEIDRIIKSGESDWKFRDRNKWRKKFKEAFKQKWKAIQGARSRLRSANTRKQVDEALRDIKRQVTYVRQLQAESHRSRFLEKEYVEVRKGVADKERAVSILRNTLRKLLTNRAKRRLKLTTMKKDLIRHLRSATKEITKAQRKQCKKKK